MIWNLKNVQNDPENRTHEGKNRLERVNGRGKKTDGGKSARRGKRTLFIYTLPPSADFPRRGSIPPPKWGRLKKDIS